MEPTHRSSKRLGKYPRIARLGLLHLHRCRIVGDVTSTARNLRTRDARVLPSNLATPRMELRYTPKMGIPLYFFLRQ